MSLSTVAENSRRVAIGIIKNDAGQILMAKRGKDVHLAGLWEFPGGKAKADESFKMALRRELAEELGIQVSESEKAFEFEYQYDDRNICFQVFKINKYSNQVASNENQRLAWVGLNEIDKFQLPPANKGIIDSLRLPSLYMIANQQSVEQDVLSNIEQQLVSGIKLVQYRAHNIGKTEYISIARQVRKLCDQYDAKMVCNCELGWVDKISPHGIHLTSSRLKEVSNKMTDFQQHQFFSASCHSQQEVEIANRAAVQCILIGPVQQTTSHQNKAMLGWEKFNQLCRFANMPVFALGGVAVSERKLAIAHGAQGIAGISAFVSG